jgi:hypothetical protein
LLAAFLAALVMVTIAGVAISLDGDQGRQGETTFVGRHVVNTPSESAGIVGGTEQTFVEGTAANTPSELRPVYMHGRNLRGLSPLSDTLGINTPTELSGGIGLPAEVYDRHQRG